MEGSAPDSVGTSASWLRCYRCWSQNLEVQVHYEGVLKVDPETGEAVEPVEEGQEAVVQCLDCLHDQPHLNLAFYEENGRGKSPLQARGEPRGGGGCREPRGGPCTGTGGGGHGEG